MALYEFTKYDTDLANFAAVITAIKDTNSYIIAKTILRIVSCMDSDHTDYTEVITIPVTDICQMSVKRVFRRISPQPFVRSASIFFKNDRFDLSFGESFTLDYNATNQNDYETYSIIINNNCKFIRACSLIANIKDTLASVRKADPNANLVTTKNLNTEVDNIIEYLINTGVITETDKTTDTEETYLEENTMTEELESTVPNANTVDDESIETDSNVEETVATDSSNEEKTETTDINESDVLSSTETVDQATKPDMDDSDSKSSDLELEEATVSAYEAFIKSTSDSVANTLLQHKDDTDAIVMMAFIDTCMRLNETERANYRTTTQWIKLIADNYHATVLYNANYTIAIRLLNSVIVDNNIFIEMIRKAVILVRNIYKIDVVDVFGSFSDNTENDCYCLEIALAPKFIKFMSDYSCPDRFPYMHNTIYPFGVFINTERNLNNARTNTIQTIQILKYLDAFNIRYKPLAMAVIKAFMSNNTFNAPIDYVYLKNSVDPNPITVSNSVLLLFDIVYKQCGYVTTTLKHNRPTDIDITVNYMLDKCYQHEFIRDCINPNDTAGSDFPSCISNSMADMFKPTMEDDVVKYENEVLSFITTCVKNSTELQQITDMPINCNDHIMSVSITAALNYIQTVICSYITTNKLDDNTASKLVDIALHILYVSTLAFTGSFEFENNDLFDDMTLSAKTLFRSIINIALCHKALVRFYDIYDESKLYDNSEAAQNIDLIYDASSNEFKSAKTIGLTNIFTVFSIDILNRMFAEIQDYMNDPDVLSAYINSISAYLNWVEKDYKANTNMSDRLRLNLYMLGKLWDDVRVFSACNNISSKYDPITKSMMASLTNDASKFVPKDTNKK